LNIKAEVLKKCGELEIQKVFDSGTELDEAKVRIAYTGICGNDHKIISRGYQITVQQTCSIILGHEASRTIVEIGKDVKGDFKIGQKTAMNFRKTCGGCYYSQNKMEHFCKRKTPFVGVMAEYGSFKESLVYKLPEDLSLDEGAFLEPLSIAVYTFDITKVKVGDFNYYRRWPLPFADAAGSGQSQSGLNAVKIFEAHKKGKAIKILLKP
jgi:threonine dehydrogenase-like Zn-dependent dehydrogenase